MLGATEVRKGMIVRYDDKLHYVMNVYHHTPGNLRAVIQIKMRDLMSGSSKEIRFGSGDKVEQAFIDQVDMEYLYAEGDQLIFMNQANYEQVPLHKELLGEDMKFLKENTACKVDFYQGRAIAIELPHTVDLKVMKTEPSLKGATITNVYKPATLETGAVIQVPPFIEEGEMIRVDTREAAYLERANTK